MSEAGESRWGVDPDHHYEIEEMTLTELQDEVKVLVAQFERGDPAVHRLARVIARLIHVTIHGA